MLKEMKAKFASKCVRSGASIKKGDPIMYDPIARKAYAKGSAPEQESDDARMFRNMNEDHADQWCRDNGI